MKPNKTNLNDVKNHKAMAFREIYNILKLRESKSKKLGETALYNNIPEKLRERKQIKFRF